MQAAVTQVAREGTTGISARARAKLNLSLAVLARRADGFHEIESLMVPVTLHDTLRVRSTAAPGVRLRVHFGGALAAPPGSALATDVPTDGRNLVVRAVEALAAEAAIDTAARGIEIELVKRIPSGSGLGGGSSDAAAALRAAQHVWGTAVPAPRLAEIAAAIGSDVPVFLAGAAAIAGGRGERIEPVAGIHPLHAVVARPAVGLSTAAVYARCTPAAAGRGQARRLAAALAAGRFRGALELLHNDLEAPAREMCPEVDRLLALLGRLGAVRPLLTGSGSACFALARSAAEARRLAVRLVLAGCPWAVPVRLAPFDRAVRARLPG